jgi:hypothetical protein
MSASGGLDLLIADGKQGTAFSQDKKKLIIGMDVSAWAFPNLFCGEEQHRDFCPEGFPLEVSLP